MTSFSKCVTEHRSSTEPQSGRWASLSLVGVKASESDSGAAGRGPGARRGTRGGGRRLRGGLQGAAVSRPGARSRSPSRSGAGEGGARAAAASAGGAAGPPHSPPAPPPRSLALTPRRWRRAARAPPAPHGRPRHGALRPPRRCPTQFSAPSQGKEEGARGH